MNYLERHRRALRIFEAIMEETGKKSAVAHLFDTIASSVSIIDTATIDEKLSPADFPKYSAIERSNGVASITFQIDSEDLITKPGLSMDVQTHCPGVVYRNGFASN